MLEVSITMFIALMSIMALIPFAIKAYLKNRKTLKLNLGDRMLNYKELKYIIPIVLLFSLTACSEVQDKWDNCQGNFDCPVCEVKECAICKEPGDLEKLGYFEKDETLSQLNNFIHNSNNVKCEFILLEDSEVSEFIQRKDNTRIKIMLNQEATMNDCTNTCVPKATSKYSQLFALGYDIKVRTDVISNYCVSDLGVILFTQRLRPNDEGHAYVLFFESNYTKDKFINNFNRRWS